MHHVVAAALVAGLLGDGCGGGLAERTERALWQRASGTDRQRQHAHIGRIPHHLHGGGRAGEDVDLYI